jgi:hypothetical protein
MRNSTKLDAEKWSKGLIPIKRLKRVCKPCWELKYCPYGPLVENFPLSRAKRKQSCEIFGHLCPVFFTNELVTETKEMRRISRSIPRKIMLRVMRRDNYTCQICDRRLKDDEIELDHKIPFSEGGSTDENNLQLTCRDCNRRKRANIES